MAERIAMRIDTQTQEDTGKGGQKLFVVRVATAITRGFQLECVKVNGRPAFRADEGTCVEARIPELMPPDDQILDHSDTKIKEVKNGIYADNLIDAAATDSEIEAVLDRLLTADKRKVIATLLGQQTIATVRRQLAEFSTNKSPTDWQAVRLGEIMDLSLAKTAEQQTFRSEVRLV